MKPEQQRIKLAEWDWWTGFGLFNGRSDQPAAYRKGCQSPEVLPDYLSDLNAVHELEKKLTDEQYQAFYECLYSMAAKQTSPEDMIRYKRFWISATASQRCEALLKTLGLWKS